MKPKKQMLTLTKSAWARKGNFLSALPLKPLLFLKNRKETASEGVELVTWAIYTIGHLTLQCPLAAGCVQTPHC